MGLGQTDLNDEAAGKKFFNDLVPSQTFDFNTSSKNQGFSGRLYAGYQFSTYFGLELGYVRSEDTRSEVAIASPNLPVSLAANNLYEISEQ